MPHAISQFCVYDLNHLCQKKGNEGDIRQREKEKDPILMPYLFHRFCVCYHVLDRKFCLGAPNSTPDLPTLPSVGRGKLFVQRDHERTCQTVVEVVSPFPPSTGWFIWSCSWVGLTCIFSVPVSARFCLG